MTVMNFNATAMFNRNITSMMRSMDLPVCEALPRLTFLSRKSSISELWVQRSLFCNSTKIPQAILSMKSLLAAHVLDNVLHHRT